MGSNWGIVDHTVHITFYHVRTIVILYLYGGLYWQKTEIIGDLWDYSQSPVSGWTRIHRFHIHIYVYMCIKKSEIQFPHPLTILNNLTHIPHSVMFCVFRSESLWNGFTNISLILDASSTEQLLEKLCLDKEEYKSFVKFDYPTMLVAEAEIARILLKILNDLIERGFLKI